MPATVLTFACSVPIRIHQQLDASDSWEPTPHPTQPQSLRPILCLPVEMSAVRKWKRPTCPAHMYYFGSNVRRSEWVHYYKVYLWVNSCWFQAIDKHKLGQTLALIRSKAINNTLKWNWKGNNGYGCGNGNGNGNKWAGLGCNRKTINKRHKLQVLLSIFNWLLLLQCLRLNILLLERREHKTCLTKYIYMYMYRDISRNFASVSVISLSKRAYVEVDC